MIYQSEHMTLNSVMDVFRGKVNDVVICENIKDGRSSYYTVLVVKDHVIVKKLVRILKEQETDCCVDMFNWENNFCLVFDYVKERKLYDFYMAGGLSLENCEEICINLIIQCMISGLPYPLLYLVLEQRQLHLLKDNSVALGYALDLEKLDENCTQDQCTMQCAIILRELLKQKTTKKKSTYIKLQLISTATTIALSTILAHVNLPKETTPKLLRISKKHWNSILLVAKQT